MALQSGTKQGVLEEDAGGYQLCLFLFISSFISLKDCYQFHLCIADKTNYYTADNSTYRSSFKLCFALVSFPCFEDNGLLFFVHCGVCFYPLGSILRKQIIVTEWCSIAVL